MKKFRLTNKTFHFYSPLLRFINWSANFVYRCSLQSKSPFLLFLRFNHAVKRVLNVQFVCISCLTQYCALLKTMKYFLSKTRTICYSKITGSSKALHLLLTLRPLDLSTNCFEMLYSILEERI